MRRACLALVANVSFAAHLGHEQLVFHRNHYAEQGRYRTVDYTYANLIAAMDILNAIGRI